MSKSRSLLPKVLISKNLLPLLVSELCTKNGIDLLTNKLSLGFDDLSGGHTIGTSACARLIHRLYNYSNTNAPDPHIDQAFLHHLQTLCPEHGDSTVRVDLDTGSVNNFDTSYYENLRSGRGVLESDSKLWTHPSTQNLVQQFISVRGPDQLTFSKKFARAMVKLSQVEVKTGNEGEIRRVCNRIN